MSDEKQKTDKNVNRHSYSTMALHWLLVLIVIFEIVTVGVRSRTGVAFHIIGGCFLGLVVVGHLIYHYLIRGGSPIVPRQGDVKASIILIKATFSGSEEPPNDKYLSEQRLAYLYILTCIILVIITGLARVVRLEHQYTALQNLRYIKILGMLHGPAIFLLVMGIAAHLGAFLIKANRPLLKSMFTGKIDLEYIKHRHAIWYAQMQKKI
ncbi:MAG: cytochrome b/b6 domain-containing protein [Peptococcaceae bacterium]|nr:cytochrome b/b6 domain-containing protein [Peptococcaceae bacterium]